MSIAYELEWELNSDVVYSRVETSRGIYMHWKVADAY
jgi:hypothetical protein